MKIGKVEKNPFKAEERNPFSRSDRPKDSSPQDWFENSEGIYSGQTGQFIEKDKKSIFAPEISILQAGEIGKKK